MSQELKKAVEDLTKVVNDERVANDERYAEIEKYGKVLPETSAKLEKIENSINALQDKITTINENVAKQQLINISVDSAEDAKVEENTKLFSLAANKSLDVEQYKNYKKTFNSYIRGGAPNQQILNEMFTGGDPEGGYTVPVEMSNQVLEKLFRTSPMRQISSVITISTDKIEWPIEETKAPIGGWVSERGARGETGTPKMGKLSIEVHEQYAEPRVTQQLLDDAAVDIEAWLTGKIEEELGRVENTAFVLGDGQGKPRGFLDYASAANDKDDEKRKWGVLQSIKTGSSGGFGTQVDALIDLVHKMHPRYRDNSSWIMNRTTLAAVRKLKDGDGNYLWQMGNVQNGAPGILHGHQIVEAEDMPDIAANSYSIAFGDFNVGYQIVDRQGIIVLRDPYTAKPYVKFYTTKRVGGDVKNFDAIKLLQFAA